VHHEVAEFVGRVESPSQDVATVSGEAYERSGKLLAPAGESVDAFLRAERRDDDHDAFGLQQPNEMRDGSFREAPCQTQLLGGRDRIRWI
jgi:hypothetical protein